MRTVRRTNPWSALVGISVATLCTTPARAQQDGEFSVQRFEPAMGPRNYLSVAGARTDGELAWSAGLMFDYQRNPFSITSCTSATNCDDPNAVNPRDTAIVEDMATWNVIGTLTPVPIVQIGLRVPVVYASGEGVDLATGGPSSAGLSGAGMGDMTIEGKFRIIGEVNDPFVLGGAAELSAPLGHATSDGNYIGNETPISGGVRAIVDFEPVEGFTIGANLRGMFKKNASFGNTTIGPELRWGVAVGYQPHELFRIIAESFGATAFSSVNGTNSLEVDGGLQLMPVDGAVVITAAGGAGILKGVGVPVARGIIGIAFTWEGTDDEDGDGIPDASDECPSDREDKDGLQDEDGCPDDDVDHDKIPDDVDACPQKPETENNFEDDDGCPDEPEDSDGDGIWDDRDKCPKAAGKMSRKEFLGCPDTDQDGVPDLKDECLEEKEDTDGFQDLDGCPDLDNDEDGVPDLEDECADEKEINNGVDDGDGCPDFGPDKDGDGLSDTVDECPDEAEVLNGVDDTDGCPDKPAARVDVDPETIALRRELLFDGAKINDEDSFRALLALANGLKNWAGIAKVEVLVTVPAADAALGKSRARSVVAALIAAGVDPKRLVAKSATGTASATTFKVLAAPRWRRP